MSFGFDCCCGCCGSVSEIDAQVPGSFSDGLCTGWTVYGDLNTYKLINAGSDNCQAGISYGSAGNFAGINCSGETNALLNVINECLGANGNNSNNVYSNFYGTLWVALSIKIIDVVLPQSEVLAQFIPGKMISPSDYIYYNYQKNGCALVAIGSVNSFQTGSLPLDYIQGFEFPGISIQTCYNASIWTLEGLTPGQIYPGQQFNLPNRLLIGGGCSPDYQVGAAYMDIHGQYQVIDNNAGTIGSVSWGSGGAKMILH